MVAVSVAIDHLREVLLSLAGFFMHLRTWRILARRILEGWRHLTHVILRFGR